MNRCSDVNRLLVRTASFALFAVAILGSASRARGDWATYQGNAAHTGYVPGFLNADHPSLSWSRPVSTNPLGGIAVGDNTVFVKGAGITALDETSGATLWNKTYSAVFPISTSAPAYDNGKVYYQTDGHSSLSGNFLHAQDARTGAAVFDASYDAQWETYLNPTPYAGQIYVGGGYYGGMYSFNGTTATQNWFGNVGQYDGWTPAVDSRYAYSFTGSGSTTPIDGQLRMIDRATGTTTHLISDSNYQWNGYTMNSAVVLGSHENAFSINEPGVVYPSFGSAGRLISWDLRADATHVPHIGWVSSNHFTGQPTLANGVLYTNDGGSLVALNELTGNRLWSWTPALGNLTGTMIATDNLIFATTGSATFAIDLATHQPVWTAGVSGTLALTDRTLFVGGINGTLYAFQIPEPSSSTLAGVGGLMLLLGWRFRSIRARTKNLPCQSSFANLHGASGVG